MVIVIHIDLHVININSLHQPLNRRRVKSCDSVCQLLMVVDVWLQIEPFSAVSAQFRAACSHHAAVPHA